MARVQIRHLVKITHFSQRLSTGLVVLLTLCLCGVIWNELFSKTAVVGSSPNSASVSNCKPLRRAANDGQWMTQINPFVVHVYSAFYDDRWSLGSMGPLVTVIVSIPGKVHKIRHCRMWYDVDGGACSANKPANDSASSFVIGSLVSVRTNIVMCQVPKQKSKATERTTGHRTGNDSWSRTADPHNEAIPVWVSLAWGSADHEATAFRVPIERVDTVHDYRQENIERLDRKQLSRRKLAVCGMTLYGDDMEPRLIIEWFQMLQLLGVEHVVLYNHSVADRVGRVVADYAARRQQVATGGFTVELRQTRRFGSDRVGQGWYGRELFRHEIPNLNDCYYRLVNRFRYIGIFDVDELIIPRHITTSTIVELIESVIARELQDNGTAKSSRMPRHIRPATFTFRQASFFRQFAYAFDADSDSRLSYFSTHRRRWQTSSVGFAPKAIFDADGCNSLDHHGCLMQTPAFQSLGGTRHPGDGDYQVNESFGLLHHYRHCCNLDSNKRFVAGFCRSQPLLYDDTVAVKYGDRLVQPLRIEYARFGLPMTAAIDTAYNVSRLCY